MATDFLVKQGRVMGGVRLVTDADVAHQTDLTNIRETGTTSSQAISAGKYFYLNGTLVRAKVDIANGATFTLNTNYEVVTAGALNELKDAISVMNAWQPYNFGTISSGTTKSCTIPTLYWNGGGIYLLAINNVYGAGGVWLLKVKNNSSIINVETLSTSDYFTITAVNATTFTVQANGAGANAIVLTRIA